MVLPLAGLLTTAHLQDRNINARQGT